jgi:hypothetical protein
MTPAQYRDALARLDLTQVAAARLLGVDDRTSRRWAQYGTHGTSEILGTLIPARGAPPWVTSNEGDPHPDLGGWGPLDVFRLVYAPAQRFGDMLPILSA